MPTPMFFGRQAFPFKNLILIRQLSVFSNLLLHQISCLLTDFGLPFPSLWHFSVCPLTHHQGIWTGKISRVCQYSRSEGIRFDIVRNVKMSSHGCRQFSCMTPWAQPAPAWSALHKGSFGGWDWREEDTVPSPSPQIFLLASLCCSLFSRDLGTQNPCVWDSPFWERHKQTYSSNPLETACVDCTEQNNDTNPVSAAEHDS